jgi:hypothetical protein
MDRDLIFGQHVYGVLLRGKVDIAARPDGYLTYSFVCSYCQTIFTSAIVQIKPKTGRLLGKDHCGCQSKSRRATRVGVSPSNKLDDRTRTITGTFQSYRSSAESRGLEFELTQSDVGGYNLSVLLLLWLTTNKAESSRSRAVVKDRCSFKRYR